MRKEIARRLAEAAARLKTTVVRFGRASPRLLPRVFLVFVLVDFDVVHLVADAPRIVLKQHWHRKAHHDLRIQWLRRLVSELFNQESDEWKPKGGD